MAEPSAATLVELFHTTCDRNRDRQALVTGAGEQPRTHTWSQYREEAVAVAVGLRRLGVVAGEHVALMLANRPEHVICDVASLLAGAVPASLYVELPREQLTHVATDSGAVVAVVEDAAMLARWQQVWSQLERLRAVVVLDPSGVRLGDRVVSYDQLRWWGRYPATDELAALERIRGELRPDDPVTLVYTSGTTGEPKGAVITHRNVLYQIETLPSVIGLEAGERVLSYLPFAHIAERVVSHYLAIGHGLTAYFVPSIDLLGDALRTARPQLLFGVPRVWEKLRERLLDGIEQEPSRARRWLARTAIEVGQRQAALRLSGRAVPRSLKLRHAVLNRLVLEQVRRTIGLDRVRRMASGGAPLSEELEVFLAGIGLEILDVYGLTEATAVVSITRPGHTRPGTVGPPLPGTEVRIGGQAQVLVRGPQVFAGYHRRPEATQQVLDADGWLDTGDLGHLDPDGSLRITGRSKDLIVTSGGENVAPSAIENAVRERSPLIAHVCAVGDRRPYIAALIALDGEALASWCRRRGLEPMSPQQAVDHPEVVAEVASAVDEANAELSRREQVRSWTIVSEEWTIDSQLLTPSQKLRRGAVIERHPRQIEQLYDSGG
ncbi:MAG: AMP-dependent synthetase/ligase [Nitriliruptoraceae bacterium]